MQNGFRRLLVPVDLSPVSDRVLRCAARLPLADEATLTLLHVVSHALPTAAQRTALHDATVALGTLAKTLKATLRGVHVRPMAIVENPATGIARFARSSKAELIVMGRCRSIRGKPFLGSTAERVIRRGQVPVLVVRRGNGRYHRPAIAMDAGEQARAAIAVLLRTLHEPRAPVHVLRVIESPYRDIYYRGLTAAQASRHEQLYAAEEAERVDQLISSALKHAGAPETTADRWKYVLPTGSPRFVVPREVRRLNADLLALGTRGRTGLAYAYLGSVASDLLRSVECDVLVVPRRAELRKASRE